jgi:hypothetical protein
VTRSGDPGDRRLADLPFPGIWRLVLRTNPRPSSGLGVDVAGTVFRLARAAALIAALRRLPDCQREVLALRVFFGLGTGTTVKVPGIAPGTVAAYLSRVAAGPVRLAACPVSSGPVLTVGGDPAHGYRTGIWPACMTAAGSPACPDASVSVQGSRVSG